ncbi:MAG: hypothetical protein AAF721_33485 [Myxococcota bacterium]
MSCTRAVAVLLLSSAAGSTPTACMTSTAPPAREGERKADAKAPTTAAAPIACQTDLDCTTCVAADCGCALTAAGSDCTAPAQCDAAGCAHHAGSCWQGACVLRDTAAAPCTTDDQCEVRADRCACALHAALVTAPRPERGCVGVACGPQPDPGQFSARCDAAASRCVLQPVAPTPTADVAVEDFELPADVKRHFLTKDLGVLKKIAAALPLTSAKRAATLLDAKGTDCEPRPQGFGVEVRNCGLGGGYVQCTVSFASWSDAIFDVSARCAASERMWDRTAPFVGQLFDATIAAGGFEVDGRVATLEQVDAGARAKAEAAVAATLGATSGVDVPPALAPAWRRLTSPRGRVVVGTACGAAGSAPQGNRAMKALVKAGREDLLRDLLRGMSAGGRVYGYVGLRLLERNTPEDDAAYDAVVALDVPVPTCGGCAIEGKKASEIDLEPFRAPP